MCVYVFLPHRIYCYFDAKKLRVFVEFGEGLKAGEKVSLRRMKEKKSKNKIFACASEHITNKSHKNINNRRIKMVIINFRRRIIPNAFMNVCMWLGIVFKFLEKNDLQKLNRRKKNPTAFEMPFNFVCYLVVDFCSPSITVAAAVALLTISPRATYQHRKQSLNEALRLLIIATFLTISIYNSECE